MYIFSYRVDEPVPGKPHLCEFQTKNCGIDAPQNELATVFAETIASLYAEAGWRVSPVGDYAYATNDVSYAIFEIFQ